MIFERDSDDDFFFFESQANAADPPIDSREIGDDAIPKERRIHTSPRPTPTN